MHSCDLVCNFFTGMGLHVVCEAGGVSLSIPAAHAVAGGRIRQDVPGGVDVERGLYAMQYDMRSWHASASLCSPAVPPTLSSL